MGQADFNIHWVYAWVQADTDPIFIGMYAGFRRILTHIFGCMQGSGGY